MENKFFNYDEILSDYESELLENNYESFFNYVASSKDKTINELISELVKKYFKNQLEQKIENSIDPLLTTVDGTYFEDLQKDGIEFYMNGANFMNLTNIFLGCFKNRLNVGEELQSAINGQEVFKELVKRGANKEQVKLQLLTIEKSLNEKLKEEKNKGVNLDKFYKTKYEKELKAVIDFQIKLGRIKSPYDRLIVVSKEISELKTEYNQTLTKADLSKDDLLRQDRIELEIEQKENWLAKEMSKYDPRIINDVINDKIESLRIELEIEEIKKGKERSKKDILEPREITELKIELTALRKQVKRDIKYIEQNREINI